MVEVRPLEGPTPLNPSQDLQEPRKVPSKDLSSGKEEEKCC